MASGVSKRRRFFTLDVFTRQRFTGNPLAVVLEAEGLDDGTMQSIAREFNLSETVFVHAPAAKAHRARLRIFTPARELPFAGHPTVGTAVLLARLDGPANQSSGQRPTAGSTGPREFVLEETVGPVPCRVQPVNLDADSGRAEFDIPSPAMKMDAALDVEAMAGALGLTSADVGLDGFPPERWSAGNPFNLVPIRNLAAMGRVRLDLARFDQAFGGAVPAAAFLFCRETTAAGVAFHARMFGPGLGMHEDPATGSAVAAFSGYLAAHVPHNDGQHLVRIEQGVEMGRPSFMDLTLRVQGGKLTSAAIGGDAVVVTEGSI